MMVMITSIHNIRIRRLLLLLAIGAALIIACEEADSYVFTARRYDPDAACLEPYKSIEVVPGGSVSSRCPLSCLTVGSDTFVSTVCPPLPANATALQLDAEACLLALEAGSCVAEDEGDAGEEEEEEEDEDAGVDASSDAGVDGDADTTIDAGDASTD
jgi:hypothetical protein